jgi:sterol 3beta-glucosyltransferase
VVHHGGAGTTAAGLRAGRPTLVCPMLGDQGFWGERVHRLGAGPRPLPLRRLDTANLADRLEQLLGNQSYRSKAAELAGAIETERGIGRAIEVLERLG